MIKIDNAKTYPPLNFFTSIISDDALTPGRYMLQLLSCDSIEVLHGRIDHFGDSTMTFKNEEKSFSGKIK